MKTTSDGGAGLAPMDCSPLRVTYSRAEIEAKLKKWMVAEFGHPSDYLTEPAAKERWYRDYGMMYHFLCDAFPMANTPVSNPDEPDQTK